MCHLQFSVKLFTRLITTHSSSTWSRNIVFRLTKRRERAGCSRRKLLHLSLHAKTESTTSGTAWSKMTLQITRQLFIVFWGNINFLQYQEKVLWSSALPWRKQFYDILRFISSADASAIAKVLQLLKKSQVPTSSLPLRVVPNRIELKPPSTSSDAPRLNFTQKV